MRWPRKSLFMQYYGAVLDAPRMASPANAAGVRAHLDATMRRARADRALTPQEVARLKAAADTVWTRRHDNLARRAQRRTASPSSPSSPSTPRSAEVARLVREAAASVERDRAARLARNRELAELRRRFEALKRG